MPRLNYGTLLENIVVLESTRLCLEHLGADGAVAFASAFAMPPLTECWCKKSEESSNRAFGYEFLKSRAVARHGPETLQRMWSVCFQNANGVPVCAFYERDGRLFYKSAGPNGALVAAMLAVQQRRRIDLWLNDNGERYCCVSTSDSPDTLTIAGRLLGMETRGSAENARGWFPDTIPRLEKWIAEGPGKGASVRIGFLDPDNYAEGGTQVSPQDHQHWLRALAGKAENVLSAMFSGCQNRGPDNAARNARLASFHRDEGDLYPQSLVFEYGNFQTGVKIRWLTDPGRVLMNLRSRVTSAWGSWHPSLGRLTVHVNGQAGN